MVVHNIILSQKKQEVEEILVLGSKRKKRLPLSFAEPSDSDSVIESENGRTAMKETIILEGRSEKWKKFLP